MLQMLTSSSLLHRNSFTQEDDVTYNTLKCRHVECFGPVYLLEQVEEPAARESRADETGERRFWLDLIFRQLRDWTVGLNPQNDDWTKSKGMA